MDLEDWNMLLAAIGLLTSVFALGYALGARS